MRVLPSGLVRVALFTPLPLLLAIPFQPVAAQTRTSAGGPDAPVHQPVHHLAVTADGGLLVTAGDRLFSYDAGIWAPTPIRPSRTRPRPR